MPRESVDRYVGRDCIGWEKLHETFTRRITLDNGKILRGDDSGRFWELTIPGRHRSSWYGVPPDGWDDRLAVRERHEVTYTTEVDVR